jgi:hypothetical protein
MSLFCYEKAKLYSLFPGKDRLRHYYTDSVHKCTFSVMPDLRSLPRTLIRGHPDVVPTKVGNHLKDWVPVFTGNPGFRLSPERLLSLNKAINGVYLPCQLMVVIYTILRN